MAIPGLSFQPNPQEDVQAQMRRRRQQGVQQALQVLSLQLPRILGARAIAPGELLNAPSNAGSPLVNAVVQSVLRTAAPQAAGGGGPSPVPMAGGGSGESNELMNLIMSVFGGGGGGGAQFPAPGQPPKPRVRPIEPPAPEPEGSFGDFASPQPGLPDFDSQY